MKFERITVNPAQMGGVPCIHGLRIRVATVVGMLADGMSAGEIPDGYPAVEPRVIETAKGTGRTLRPNTILRMEV